MRTRSSTSVATATEEGGGLATGHFVLKCPQHETSLWLWASVPPVGIRDACCTSSEEHFNQNKDTRGIVTSKRPASKDVEESCKRKSFKSGLNLKRKFGRRTSVRLSFLQTWVLVQSDLQHFRAVVTGLCCFPAALLTVISVRLVVVLSEMKNESKCVSPPAGVSHQWSCCRSAGTLHIKAFGISHLSAPRYVWLQHVFNFNRSTSSSSSYRCWCKAAFITGGLLTDCTLVPGSLTDCHSFNVSCLKVSGTLFCWVQRV